jgi:hypothetical protein
VTPKGPDDLDRPAVHRRQAIPTVADDAGPGLLTIAARRDIDAKLRELVALLAPGQVGEPVYTITDKPGGLCRLEVDLMFDAKTANRAATKRATDTTPR